MIAPSRRQQVTLMFIADFTHAHGYPPSYSQIGAAMGLASTSTVWMMVAALERKGLVRREHGQARTLVVVPQAAA